MKHPTAEEWMSFLYDELNAAEHAGMADHLRQCPECAARIHEWETARKNLHWPVKARRTVAKRASAAFAGSFLKWAAAAIIVGGVGFMAGRVTSATGDMAKVRAALAPEIRAQVRSTQAEMRQEFAQLLRRELDKTSQATLATAGEQTREWLADCVATLEAQRLEDNRNLYASLEQLQTQRAADYLQLKKEVDTIAVNADAGLRHTEQLIQFTRLNQTEDLSKSP
jgi:hypothetical protein